MYEVKSTTAGSHSSASFGTLPPGMAASERPDSNEMVAERIRLIRLAYGAVQGHAREMSQVEFANLIGISKQSLNNAETGDNRIGLDSAMAIARRVGVSLDYIYFGNRNGLPHAIAIEIDRIEGVRAMQSRRK
jgi:DNA-binding XRE family transcriptional regulator